MLYSPNTFSIDVEKLMAGELDISKNNQKKKDPLFNSNAFLQLKPMVSLLSLCIPVRISETWLI